MKNTATQILCSPHPIGSLPRRYSPKFARLMRQIRAADPCLADDIQAQIRAAQAAERKARHLLARFRIATRRVKIHDFYATH